MINSPPPDQSPEALPNADVLADGPPAESRSIVVESDDEAFARLALLKQTEYDRVRKEEAKKLGIQVKTLDAGVKAARSDNTDTPLSPFQEIEPHQDAVDPTEVLNEIVAAIRRFIVMEPEQADACALWAAQTHFVDVLDVSPLLIFNAPERECAKTEAQIIVGNFSYRPLPAANISVSALFRSIESLKPTLLIDECDTFLRENPELHGLVNAGYKRGGFVIRTEAKGEGFEPRIFSVYCPKSLAGIALERHLPDSMMSRAIVINMRRKLVHESVERRRHADPQLFEILNSKLARFANDYSRQVRLARPALPDELSDRSQDNWEGLFAIAECAGPEWLRRATDAALKLSSASESSASTGNELLADIKGIFEQKKVFKISTVDLIDALTRDDEKSWSTFNRGKPFSPRQLAQKLAVYGIKSKTVRMASGTPKGYDFSQFEDVFARYLATPEKMPPQRHAATLESVSVADDAQHGGTDFVSDGVSVPQVPRDPHDAIAPCGTRTAEEVEKHWASVGLVMPDMDRGGVADTPGGLAETDVDGF